MRILVLGNGAAGAEKQALALSARLRAHLIRAGAVSTEDAVQLVRVPLRQDAIFPKLPPALQLLGARATRDPFFGYAATDDHRRQLCGGDDRGASRRRIVIGCGRTTVALCAALKQPWARASATTSPSEVFNIQIQHPRVPLELFDAVITPRHDIMGKSEAAVRPSNLHLTYGTVTSIDHHALRREGAKWEQTLARYTSQGRTCFVWLVGGPCRGFPFSEEDAHAMVDQVLYQVTQLRPNASLLVTFSRRTPPKVQAAIRNRLESALSTDTELFLWDGRGANPFDAMLHHASAIITTPDSISMMTEAIATGKPVFTVCADRISGKFQHFHDTLFREGFTHALSAEAQGKTPINLHAPSQRGRKAIEAELEALATALTANILRQ